MINPTSWDSFSVSRSDSYAQHNFHINVEVRNEGLSVTGEVRGEDGSVYTDAEGILLSPEDAKNIYALEPALLPDCSQTPAETSGQDCEAFVLDQSDVRIQVVCTDGRMLEKCDENNFSITVYQIVRPYFENKYHIND